MTVEQPLHRTIVRLCAWLCMTAGLPVGAAAQVTDNGADSLRTATVEIAPESRNDSVQETVPLRETTETHMPDSLAEQQNDTIAAGSLLTVEDSTALAKATKKAAKKVGRDWATWKPNPQRAMWLAVVLPGAGQIYNRKYWKLPIVYGGFVGCIYALRWNNQMYRDYAQAYMDLVDDDPTTESYNEFLHLGAEITSSNQSRYETLFKKRKDRYRRYRDLSVFALIGVYAISIIDAYVDASLSEFDISRDLSMRVEPTLINDTQERNPLKSTSLGVSCSLNF